MGRRTALGDRPERRFCAPLLEVSLTLRRELSDGVVRVEPEDDEFSINYSLIGELLGDNENDLQDRLADLAELVPDFPVTAGEFDDFWNGFRMIATELSLSNALPRPRGSRSGAAENDDAVAVYDLLVRAGKEGRVKHEKASLEIIDFFLPEIPDDDRFYLLPATAIILGRRAGHPLSALRELESMTNVPLYNTAFGSVFDPQSAEPPDAASSRDVILEDAMPLPLTRTQDAIVRSARTSPLTVVTGPPGTGKSYTITAIVLDALLRGESVLVASQMDKAVQVVAEKVASIAGQHSIARSGGRAARTRLWQNKFPDSTGPRRKLAAPAVGGFRQQRSAFAKLAKRLGLLEIRYEEIVRQEREWSESWQSFQRLQPTSSLPVQDIPDRRVRKAIAVGQPARRALAGTPSWMKRLWGEWHKSRSLQLLQVPRDWPSSLDEIDELLRCSCYARSSWPSSSDFERRFPQISSGKSWPMFSNDCPNVP